MTQPHHKSTDSDMAGDLIPFPDRKPEPIRGEVADADHDGVPDIGHTGTPGALVERPDAEPEHVGPVFDAELVDDDEFSTARWRQTMQARPVVPGWLRDSGQRADAAKWTVRFAWYRVKSVAHRRRGNEHRAGKRGAGRGIPASVGAPAIGTALRRR
jgi:hypothetical protein